MKKIITMLVMGLIIESVANAGIITLDKGRV